MGKSINAPIDAYGVPVREIEVAGRKAYSWEMGVGDCVLQMEVSSDNTVRKVRLTGYPEVCEGYLR